MANNRIMMSLLSGMLLLQLIGCHEPQGKVQGSTIDSIKKDTLKPIVPENSVKVSVDSNFFKKPLVDCKLEQKEEEIKRKKLNSGPKWGDLTQCLSKIMRNIK